MAKRKPIPPPDEFSDEFSIPFFPEFIEGSRLGADIFPADERIGADGMINCPFLPLRDLVLFPQMVMPLFVGRDRSLSAIQAAIAHREPIIVAAQLDPEQDNPGKNEVFLFGTQANVGRTLRMPDQTTSILAQGRRRVEILNFTQWDPYPRVQARVISEPNDWDSVSTEALMRAVTTLFEKVVDLNRNLPEELLAFVINIDEPGWLADFMASALNLPLIVRQEILETVKPDARLQKMSTFLAQELDLLELEGEIQAKIQQEVDKSQREHFLREQIRVIQGELGEADIFTQELSELSELVAKKKMPAQARAKTEKELARLKAMPPMSPEVGIIRTYLDLILDLPWLEESADNLDVRHVADVLDADHYGLEKIKERVLEFIAVKHLTPNTMRAPILCFVGPPGTGKTSLGKSIAGAMGREFARVSLGGIRDEAEIRGHRRTYIGAMPGRIIQAIRRAGTNNPLIILDEIDKIGQDFRGDPASALLELLDPEQNHAFSDHYLELDFDLSKAMFITTANWLDPIPPALRDRMEVIEFSGYLEEEKLEICRQFVIPRQIAQHGLLKAGLRFEDDSLKTLIRQYTYEAGVRNLEREIANLCRKTARRVAEHKKYVRRITSELVVELLGPPPFSRDLIREEDEVGVVTGVAWTSAGGDILAIEVNLMPGKGNLTLTGQMGIVMQESAQAALSYTRAHAIQWGVKPERFEKTDVHIHIPEGSVPKDGPSAGVAMATALISAFTNRPVRRDVGMTGEITLRGRVLPVGGIREKALAAKRAGISTFIMPQRNENDLSKIPKNLRQEMNIVLIDRIGQLLDIALLIPLATPEPSENGRWEVENQ